MALRLYLILNTLLLIDSSYSQFNSSTYNIEDAEIHFREFVKTYEKQYENDAEYARRLNIFRDNLIDINELKYSDNHVLANHDINPFTDMSWEEVQDKYLGYREDFENVVYKPVGDMFKDSKNFIPPTFFDWRRVPGVLNPVKDQKQCGSCWAFSAIAFLESAYAIINNKFATLSEEQLVDCIPETSCYRGGSFIKAFDYLKSTAGVELNQDYPYTAGSSGKAGECRNEGENAVVRVTEAVSFLNVTANELKYLVMRYGAVSVSFHVYNTFRFYKGGVISPTDEECPPNFGTNHAVNIVGFGTVNQELDYWIVRNSWGRHWGDHGYFKIVAGKCKLGEVASVAEIVNENWL